MEKPPVVILCGGEGTRLKEETEYKPKPMVSIGGLPILWHIMKTYSHYGFDNFILCLGYKGYSIKNFFLSHQMMHNDFTIMLKDHSNNLKYHGKEEEDWTVTFAETGLKAQTGARIKRIEKYVDSDNFLATYGDGLSDVNLDSLYTFHKKQNTIATLTAVHPSSKFGMVKPGKNGLIQEFVEKPVLEDYVGGGFFSFKKDIFDYLDDDDNCILERKPFTELVTNKQFSFFEHNGFWHAMDTYKDYLELNQMWDSGKKPWKVWD
ncbi:MAG TPA: sugar phosphate nucleotidyltransferase [Candidatus Bilamarchaeaceae archaeon]|nr:sugar phosphate nucleotidyltransferase [Candidatus Bilamarchaeaceae archaeon]